MSNACRVCWFFLFFFYFFFITLPTCIIWSIGLIIQPPPPWPCSILQAESLTESTIKSRILLPKHNVTARAKPEHTFGKKYYSQPRTEQSFGEKRGKKRGWKKRDQTPGVFFSGLLLGHCFNSNRSLSTSRRAFSSDVWTRIALVFSRNIKKVRFSFFFLSVPWKRAGQSWSKRRS